MPTKKPKPRKKASPKLDLPTAALMLSLASYRGDDFAAEYFKTTSRTVQRYKAQAVRDSALSALVDQEKALLVDSQREKLALTLHAGLDRIIELVREAKVDQLRDVVGAVKVVLEQGTARDVVLPHERLRHHRQSPPDGGVAGSSEGHGPAGGNGAANGSNGHGTVDSPVH